MKNDGFLVTVGACVVVLQILGAWPEEQQRALPSMRVTGTFTASEEVAKRETYLRLWPADTYVYLEKARSKEWMEAMYQRFACQIVHVRGNYIDVGRPLAVGAVKTQTHEMYEWPSETLVSVFPGADRDIGPAGQTPGGWRVMQVVNDREVLIYLRGFSGRCHVYGVDTKKLVDDAEFKATLVSIGTHSYETVTGARATVPSYTLYGPLTREQFAEALGRGTRLVSYQARIALGESQDQENRRRNPPKPSLIGPKGEVLMFDQPLSHLWDKRPKVTQIEFVEVPVP